jgi:Ohr subfamily peroxiredoxin
MSILYTAEATAVGGRDGGVKSADGVLDLQLAIPKEMGGPGGAKTNPEELFAAGYSACFLSALKLVASRDKVNVHDAAVTARVGIGPNDAGGFGLEVELDVVLPKAELAAAEAVVRAAHQVCPYSNATRGNIPVKLTVSAAGAPAQPLEDALSP